MIFPYETIHPARSKPVMTLIIIAVTTIIFAVQLVYGISEPHGKGNALLPSIEQFGLFPSEISGHENGIYKNVPVEYKGFLPAWVTLLTSVFLHASFWHLLGNMWFLWLFGPSVEHVMGKFKFLLFYLSGGIAASALQTLLNLFSPIPVVGASGAIMAVAGAFIVLFPMSKIKTLVWWVFFIQTLLLPAWIYIGLMFILDFTQLMMTGLTRMSTGTAVAAHVGGFLYGFLIALSLRKKLNLRAQHPRGPREPEYRIS